MWWEFWYFRITQLFSGMVNAITHWLSLVKSLQFDKTDTEFQDGFVNSSSKWPEVEMIWRREILFLCWVQILTMSHNWEEKMKSQSSIALKLKIIVVGREQMPFFWQNMLVRLHTQQMKTSKFDRVWWGRVNSYLSYIGTIVSNFIGTTIWSSVSRTLLHKTQDHHVISDHTIGFVVWENQFLGTYLLIWKPYGRFRVPMKGPWQLWSQSFLGYSNMI